jgi:glycoprotein endo-alpha-1,2-mannosidase
MILGSIGGLIMFRKIFFLVSFILMLGLPLTHPARAELVGWWKFDESSGNTATDSSGNGFNIGLNNTTWEDGLFGNAVHFHGRGSGNSEYFMYNDNAITICAWVWHDTFRINKIERYVTVAPEVAVIRKEADGRLHFYIKTGGNLKHLWVNNVLTEGQWHYVGGTWGGASQRLYINGEEIANQVQGGVLGHTSNVGVSSGDEPLNGKLDEVRIYNHALTRAAIQVLMHGQERSSAHNPIPANGATSVDMDIILSWTPGFNAQLHTVYYGDNFDNVKYAAGGLPQSTPRFTPVQLEPGKTYYWRVDEFDGVQRHRGDIWSFTTARAGDGWAYDGGILVGAYYYPWYGPGQHPVSDSLRLHLLPQQASELGEYDSSSSEVISRHIDYSHRANIHFWLCSWWGPGTNEDNVFRLSILPHPYANELRYAVLYESTGRLGSFSNPDYSNLLSDFQYFANNYFSNPNYLKINERPVVFIYLTRVYFRNPSGYDALADLRAAFPDIYIIADDIFGRNYSSNNASKWDAVTAYDVYGQTLQPYGSTKAALDELKRIISQAKTAANNVGVGFIPFATPGFNDRYIRSGHKGAPRYFEDEPASVEGDLFRAMLRDIVVPKVDPLAQNILMVTSFNEWHEDTQIEPTIGTAGKTNIDDSASGSEYTQGDYYTDYGYLYLDILCQETSSLPVDYLSDALDTSLSFTTGGSADWFAQSTTTRYDGDAAQSGDISHSQESWMQTMVSGTGTVKFNWKVSSEEDFDFLEFYIDGSLQDRISSLVNWEQKTYTISTSGSHTLEWRYIKDGSGDSGSDCGWVDKVEWLAS